MAGTVKHSLEKLEAALRRYPRELLAADVRARNRTAASSRTQAVRRLRADLPIKAGALRRQIKVSRAVLGKAPAVLEFSAKRFRLFGNWNARQSAAGVRIGRVPWRMESLDGEPIAPQALAHAFIQRARASGVPNVWVRVGARRYPITAILASSVSTTLRDRGHKNALLEFGRARFREVRAQEMNYRIAKVVKSLGA